MTLYFRTAVQVAGNPDGRNFLQKDEVMSSSRGWREFSAQLKARAPELTELLERFDRSPKEDPEHPIYLAGDKPLTLAWTSDECRELFLGMARASKGATESAYDFWEFLALVCCGINEEGICCY